VFYKITVTAELSATVYPAIETRVLRYVPVLPRRHGPGMRPLENRAEIPGMLGGFQAVRGCCDGSFRTIAYVRDVLER
jgi:hypothetical protein